MYVLQFGPARSALCDYFYVRGSYYAANFFDGDRLRAYFCHANGLHVCRAADGNWCMKRSDGGHVARSSSMATLFRCWAVKGPKSVIAKDFRKAPNLEQRSGRPSRAARRPQMKSSMEKVRS